MKIIQRFKNADDLESLLETTEGVIGRLDSSGFCVLSLDGQELKPCPFCGQTMVVHIEDPGELICAWCGSRGPTSFRSLGDLIDGWNRRGEYKVETRVRRTDGL